MAPRFRNVRDSLLYEYAKLIADAAVAGRSDRAPVDRSGSSYWSFVGRTFRKLVAEEISPSTILRENKLMVTSGQQCAYCGSTSVVTSEVGQVLIRPGLPCSAPRTDG